MGSTIDNQSSFTNTFTIHTGTDINAVFNDLPVATVQGISYSVTRQKAPIYTMGSADLRAIARSKRGIAGSSIFTTTDKHALHDFMKHSTYAAKQASLATTAANPHNNNTAQTVLTGTETSSAGLISGSVLDTLSQEQNTVTNTTRTVGSVVARPMYADEILPFDSTLSSANEFGKGSVMRIVGLEVLNEGSGMSIDDTSNEIQMTYLARLIVPWMEFENVSNPNSVV